MVAARKSKPREHRWRVSLIKSTPQKYLGAVYASDEATALKEAAREFKINDTLRNRLIAQREG